MVSILSAISSFGVLPRLAGDPKRLLHHLGLGFWSFLAEPTAGLLQVRRPAHTAYAAFVLANTDATNLIDLQLLASGSRPCPSFTRAVQSQLRILAFFPASHIVNYRAYCA